MTYTNASPRYADYDPNSAFWVDIIRNRRDRYREQLTDPAMAACIGEVAGLDVLDLAGGEGYWARRLADGGARVTSIDIAIELVAAARELEATEQRGIRFEHGSAYDLPFGDASFDLVVANHALNSLEDLDRALSEAARVLRPDGRMVALCLHPCFTGADMNDPTWPARYFTCRSKEHRFLVDGEHAPDTVTGFHRSLETYVAAFAGAGMVLTGLSEPHPTGEMLSDPWWQQWWDRPMFVIFNASR